MTRGKVIHERVLAISPVHWGVGFAVFEGFPHLIDHGLRVAPPRGKKDIKNERPEKLMAWYAPDVVVLETGRQSPQIRAYIEEIKAIAKRRKIRVTTYSRNRVRECFAQGLGQQKPATNADIVGSIVKEFPELRLRRPPIREPWMSEDFRMSIFQATALAVTFYSVESKSSAK